MIRGFGGILAVAIATLIVCCSADSQQEQDGTINNQHSGNRFEGNGHKTRNSDAVGGLARGVRETRHLGLLPYLLGRRYEYSPYKSAEYGLLSDVYPKRNFDEIDRSDLDPFVYKRNFDETEQSAMRFPYATKRFLHFYGPNNLDSPSSFDKKRYRPDYPMDEIDLSHFPIGSKRSMDLYPLLPRLR